MSFSEHADITRELAAAGVRFERWQASQPIRPGDAPEAVIAAYRGDIDRLMREEGLPGRGRHQPDPDHLDKALRAVFNEHTHAEDEVRFFVAGRGLFTLHVGDSVYEVLCEAGDLIGCPTARATGST